MDNIKILIADNSSVYKKMFAQAAAEIDKTSVVSFASDGDETLRKVIRQDFDIIIIDKELPGKNIVDLIKAIIRESPKFLILITSRPTPSNEKFFAEALAVF